MQILNRHHLSKPSRAATPWPAEAVYVGRGHPLGNPYRIRQDGTREQVLDKYCAWIEARIARGIPVCSVYEPARGPTTC